jgi:hypothetical protein
MERNKGPFRISDKAAQYSITHKAGWDMSIETHGIRYAEELVAMPSVRAVKYMEQNGWTFYEPSNRMIFMHSDGKCIRYYPGYVEDGFDEEDGCEVIDGVDHIYIADTDRIIDFMLKAKAQYASR